MKRIFFVCIIFLICSGEFISASVLVPGSPVNPATTLPVGINFFTISNELADAVFISARATGAGEYAVAGYKSGQKVFVPYAPETVSLNDESSVTNPLYNAEIDLVSFISQQLFAFFAVPDKNNPILYYRPSQNTLFSVSPLPDAAGNPASSVVAMTGGYAGNYSAVTPQGSTNFGDPGSGILVSSGTTTAIQLITTLPLNATSPFFTLGTDPVTMTNGASLAWAPSLRMFYCAGVQMTSGAAPTDRIALVARGVEGANSTLFAILSRFFDPSTLVSGTNYGLVATGASVTGVINFVQMMDTSTRQPLIVTNGRILNNGEMPSDVQNQVYAFPLSRVFVANTKVDALLVDISGVLAAQGTLNPALTASDLYTIDDAAVQVGQGPLPANVVLNQLLVNGDCVYAIVNNLVPGIYMSRALFDE